MTTFTIPGKPYAKKRPRSGVNKATGRSRTYNAPGNASFERQVGILANRHFPAPHTGPVSVRVEAVFCPASSWSNRRRNAAMGSAHTQKPDGDNVLKAIKDALNRIAWADDAQCADSTVTKRWGPVEQTTVTVTPIRGGAA